MSDPLWNASRVCVELGISRSSLYRLVREGRLRKVVVPHGGPRYRSSEVAALVRPARQPTLTVVPKLSSGA